MKRLYIENGPMEFKRDSFGTAQRQVYTLNYDTGFEQVDIDNLLRTKFY